LFASIKEESVISSHDSPSIYKIPEVLESQGIVKVIAGKLLLRNCTPRWGDWKTIAKSFYHYNGSISIAIIGKYVSLPDSYHALLHAGANIGRKVDVEWIESERLEKGDKKLDCLKRFDGIMIPGGFGRRGSEGIINAANFARLQDKPYLGICFGFQLAIVAFARNACNLNNASSTELCPYTKHPVVQFMPEQKTHQDMGGTMRLGVHNIEIMSHTKASEIYGKSMIQRRHRHRFEFNQEYRTIIEEHGMVLSGFSDNGRRTEILELPDCKFYFAVQYHSEFNSRPGKPEQAFEAFIRACAF
jgi:CTP synthase